MRLVVLLPGNTAISHSCVCQFGFIGFGAESTRGHEQVQGEDIVKGILVHDHDGVHFQNTIGRGLDQTDRKHRLALL